MDVQWGVGIRKYRKAKRTNKLPIIPLPINNILVIYIQSICSIVIEYCQTTLPPSNIELEFCCNCLTYRSVVFI